MEEERKMWRSEEEEDSLRYTGHWSRDIGLGGSGPTPILTFVDTRRSGRYAPILLAPAEGWGPFGPLGALRALLGAFGPQ